MHLRVPVAWLEVVGRGRNGPLQRRQEAKVAGVGDDGDVGLHQGLQRGRTAPVSHQQAA